MGVDRMTISKYLKTHIRYKSYKMGRGGCQALVRLPAGRGPCPQRQGDPGLAECQFARLLGEGVVDAGKPRLQPFGLLLLGACERTINRAPHNTLNSLKTSIVAGFANMPREEVTRACSGFRSRVEKVIEAEGSFFQ